jgi:L-ribulokinase
MIGSTLTTKPEDGYRALLESTAFGARKIVETFRNAGVPVEEFIVAGGLLKNAFLMQMYCDVLQLPLSVINSSQGPALGS